MRPNLDCIGKTYPPQVYEVGREKIKEYAFAIGDTNPLYTDLEFARKSKYGNIIAPPTFAVVYQREAIAFLFYDTELNMNIPFVVHGEQEFQFFEIVKSGDELTTVGKIVNIYEKVGEKGSLDFIVAEYDSTNQHGRLVTKGIMNLVVRRVE